MAPRGEDIDGMELIKRFVGSDLVYKFNRSPVAIIALAVTVLLIGGAVLAPLVTSQNPFDPASLNLMNGFSKPMEPNQFTGDTFIFGADDLLEGGFIVRLKLDQIGFGPLQLADFIGLDTCLAVMHVLYDGLADSKYRPCPLLVKYVEAGWLGRKTGRGFYDYSGDEPVPTR